MRNCIQIIIVLSLMLGGAALLAQEAGFKIIVNESNPVTTLNVKQVSKFFLKKVTTWVDGQSVLPVDLPEQSPARESFSKRIHGKKVLAVKSYWQQMIFSGRAVPPPEKPSEEEVVTFVRANRGAIGYLSANTSAEGVKVVELAE